MMGIVARLPRFQWSRQGKPNRHFCSDRGRLPCTHSKLSYSTVRCTGPLADSRTVMVETDRAAVVWFRSTDLRTADHQPLRAAVESGAGSLLPLFCMNPASTNPRVEEGFKHGIPQTGPHKARFIIEAMRSLDDELRTVQSQLVTSFGSPSEAIAACARAASQHCRQLDLYYYQRIGRSYQKQEGEVSASLRAAAQASGIAATIHTFWGATLYHPDDVAKVPFAQPKRQPVLQPPPVSASQLQQCCWRLPHVMTDFRKAMEQHAQVRSPLPAPHHVPPLPEVLPQLQTVPDTVRGLYEAAGTLQHVHALQELCGQQLNMSKEVDARSAMPFQGGTGQGIERLHRFLHGQEQQDVVRDAPICLFKEQRMTSHGIDNSAKLSAYLAAGCLSPREVHAAAEELLQVGGSAGEGAACLQMHLTIRDFFIFTAIKAGDSLLEAAGLAHKEHKWLHDAQMFSRWARGETGFPFVDACMRELAATGYMSNRGRQNVASFLTKELSLDWRLGAQLFESLLIDHDYAVNYANWNYVAGIGNDPRDRLFRTISQGLRYDPDAKLIKEWIPELRPFPAEVAHMPWDGSNDQQQHIYQAYCRPMVDPASQMQKKTS